LHWLVGFLNRYASHTEKESPKSAKPGGTGVLTCA